MKAMIKTISKVLGKVARNEEGASAVEYAILAAVIGAGLFTAAGSLKGSITTAFSTISGYMTGAAGSGTTTPTT